MFVNQIETALYFNEIDDFEAKRESIAKNLALLMNKNHHDIDDVFIIVKDIDKEDKSDSELVALTNGLAISFLCNMTDLDDYKNVINDFIKKLYFQLYNNVESDDFIENYDKFINKIVIKYKKAIEIKKSYNDIVKNFKYRFLKDKFVEKYYPILDLSLTLNIDNNGSKQVFKFGPIESEQATNYFLDEIKVDFNGVYFNAVVCLDEVANIEKLDALIKKTNREIEKTMGYMEGDTAHGIN